MRTPQEAHFHISKTQSPDPRYFAMLNNAVAIAGTTLEGGNTTKALAYYRSLQDVQIANCPLEFNLSQTQLNALQQAFANLTQINDFFNAGAHQNRLDESQFIQQLTELMDKQATKAGVCYLPSGWKGKPDEPGHFAGLKCRQLENGHYALSVINKGAGAQYHSQLIGSKNKDKCLYQSSEYEVDLKSQSGQMLLKHLLELQFDPHKHLEDDNTNAYSEHDLYGLLKIHGKEMPIKEKLSEKIRGYQRAGTCTVTNIDAMAQDILIDNDANPKDCKRYRFVLKLKSILTQFEEYKNGHCPRDVFAWAIREFAVRMSKEFRHSLTDEEMIWCGEQLAQIKEQLKQDEQAELQKHCASHPLPIIKGQAPSWPQKLVDIRIKKKNNYYYDEDDEIERSIPSNILPNEVLSLLHYCDAPIFEILNALPHCSGLATDDFWEKVPEKDVPDIIRILVKLTGDFFHTDSPHKHTKQLAAGLIAYDIAAQLLFFHNDYGDKLKVRKGEMLKYTLALDDSYSEKNFYNDPAVYFTIKRIVSNFQSRASFGQKRILSNAVNYKGNQYDSTVQYIVNEVLTEKQRNDINTKLKKKFNKESYSDIELFEYAIENNFLNDEIKDLMHLSTLAHLGYTRGQLYKKPNLKEGLLWAFNDETEFYKRLEEQETSTIQYPQCSEDASIIHQDFSENCSYYYTRESYNSPEMIDELNHIEFTPSFQVLRLLAFIRRSPEKLQHKAVRDRICNKLFKYGKLDEALCNQIDSLKLTTQHAFKALLNVNQADNLQDSELLIWSAKLSQNLRCYIEVGAELYHFSLEDFALPSFSPLLLEKLRIEKNPTTRAQLASILFNDYRNKAPLEAKDYASMLVFRMIANQNYEASLECEDLWRERRDEIARLSNNKEMISALDELMSDYMSVSFSKNCSFDENKDFNIHLVSGSFMKSGKLITEQTLPLFLYNQSLFDRLQLTKENISIYKTYNNDFISGDGKWTFQTSNNKIQSTHRKITLENQGLPFKLLEKDELKQLVKDNNPFESVAQCESNYLYWQSEKDKDLFFVQDKKNEGKAFWYSLKKPTIYQLEKNTQDEWSRNGKIHFNLHENQTTTKIEKAWSRRLSPIFGSQNNQLIAEVSNNMCHLQSIESLLLNLSFTPENDKLLSNDYPGYHLSNQKALECLNGFDGLILLENEQGDRKILLPAFAFKEGEKNNAFNHDIIDHGELVNPSQAYYNLHLDKHNELVGESPEANLYLAILYRSLGDFQRAFTYLERAHSVKNLTPEMKTIIYQVLRRKISSPLGAAFDVKLSHYYLEHTQKWSKKEKNQKIKYHSIWNSWVSGQTRRYFNAMSLYKEDISIFPVYCRMPQTESNNGKTYLKARAPIPVRLMIVLSSISTSDLRIWIREKQMSTTSISTSLRLPNENQNQNPAENYLIQHFIELFDDALSGDPEKTHKVKIKLFLLLQNDAIAPSSMLFSFILCVMKYPEYFKTIGSFDNPFALIMKVGIIISENYSKLFSRYDLFDETDPSHDHLIIPPSKPATQKTIFVEFNIANISQEAQYKHPLAALLEHMSIRKKPIATKDFALDSTELPNASLIEKKLIAQYKKGHIENQSKYQSQYQVKDGLDLFLFKEELGKSIHSDTSNLHQLEKKLLERANHLINDNQALSQELLAQRASEKRLNITIADLFESYLKQDPVLLTTHNPALNQADIEILYAELSAYALHHCRIDQARDILKDLGDAKSAQDILPWQWQLIGEKLDKKRAYDIHEFPEFLVYEYATGRMLREDQVSILKKIITLIESDPDDYRKMRHCLLQFAAGGGKTSVLLPILAQRFARKGFMPVIFNTNELYQIGLEDIPANLKQSFNQNVEVLEIELDHVWTEEEFVRLLDCLKRWQKEGKCLLLKPVTWHAINIAQKLCELGESQIVGAKEILQFFKNNCVKLEDETHIISDPLQQSIKCYGSNMQTIPEHEIILLQTLYESIMGISNHSEKIAKLTGLKERRGRPIRPEELKELQTKLADILIKKLDDDEELLRTYFLSESPERPQWLEELQGWNKERFDTIIFARALLHTFLPHVLSKKIHDDYGFSIHEGDLTAAPKHDKTPTTAHFGDPRLVAAFSMQLYYQNGLSPLHVKQLLDFLVEEHWNERQWNTDLSRPTEAELFLLNCIPESLPFHCMANLQAIEEQLQSTPSFFKHPQVIKKFLTQFVLPQIKSPKKRVTSTPVELDSGFKRSLKVSATPGLPELYSNLSLENCFMDESFEAQVIDTLFKIQNRSLCTFNEIQSPAEFFQQFPPDLLESMTTLIDRGGLLSDYDASAIISDYLGLDKKAANTAAFFSPTHLHLRTKDTQVKEEDIKGAGLVEVLKKQGLKPEEFLLFLFLDLSKTTGVDIKRPHHDKGGLTVGKQQTMTQTIQGVMRERQVLIEDAQTFRFLMFKSLYREIYSDEPEDSFDPIKLCHWMIRNEANQLAPKLINHAYQDIENTIRDGRLVEEQEQDFSAGNLYELDTKQLPTREVLTHYKNQLCIKLGIQTLPKEMEQRIEKTITDTEKLIENLHIARESTLNNEVLQELEKNLKQEQTLQMQKQVSIQQSRFEESYDDYETIESYSKSDTLESAFDAPLLQLPNCKNISLPPLHFRQEHFAVTQEAVAATSLTQLKPIKTLLVKINPQDNSLEYLALTAAGLEYYSWLLIHTKQDDAPYSYALLSSDGDVLGTSANFSASKCENLVETNHCKQMLAYVNFLNGNISNPIVLSEVIKLYNWTIEQYDALKEAIKQIHVTFTPIALDINLSLFRLFWPQSASTEEINVHQRYKKPQEATTKPITMQELEPVILSKEQEESSPPIPHPQRELNNPYMFNEPIVPMEQQAPLANKWGEPERPSSGAKSIGYERH